MSFALIRLNSERFAFADSLYPVQEQYGQGLQCLLVRQSISKMCLPE